MTEVEQPCYIIINSPGDAETLKDTQLRNDIENGNLKIKVEALKKLVFGLLNGEKLPSYMLILVIRYLLPSQDHQIKKLLLLFWEIVPKRNAAGKLLPEMILVCDAYRKDLQHPNEFVRGSTLRFLSKLKEPELLEPLMPSIRSCLEHKHSYVRRNAVLAIYTIYRNFEFLIPDAPELISNFLEAEQDASCKRNAFIMLIHADQERALNYLHSCMDQVQSFNEILQLVIVELIYKVCHHNPSERARFIRCIYNLLNSTSSSVRYEAAGTLVAISSAPTAVKAASSCYIDLIVKESDNNVKLIVLDRLLTLKDQHVNNEKVLQEMMMDILRLLNSTDLEVRRKTLELALELVSSRNVEDLIGVLRKEVQKTQGLMELQDDTLKYRQLLVRTLHNCCLKFPDYLPTFIPLLVEFLSDPNDLAACDVILLLRESVQRHPHLSQAITSKLLEIFPMIRSINIFRGVLWILGEYCDTLEEMDLFLTLIEQSLGKIPIVEERGEEEVGEEGKGPGEKVAKKEETSGRPMITPDGTYATQSALSANTTGATTTKGGLDAKMPPLREFLMNGDFFIAASLANSLTKLAFHYDSLDGTKPANSNAFFAKIMLILAAIIRLGQSPQPKKMITLDDSDRIMLCLKALAEKPAGIKKIFTKNCRNSLLKMLEMSQKQSVSVDPSNPALTSKRKDNKSYLIQPDQSITFLPLVKSSDLETAEDQFEVSLMRAMGVDGKTEGDRDVTLTSKLNKVTQLTGFSDPIYAEAYVHVNQYDISLDVLIVNQTDDTLQNLDLELATLGDLKLVEKPVPVTLGPNDFCNIKASIKVTSTENGIIFGNIVYDVGSGVGDRNVVVLNDVHVDIVDYIQPGTVSDADFRHMWAEFEWENKVSVNTNLNDLNLFLAHVVKCTNMRCLTPQQALGGECGFLAANLYAKSIFGEDALANISLEKLSKADATISGHVRIRAKTQGMALSLGDKINQSQKKN